MSQVIICLMGPTASGKTDLACQLADMFPFEIVSVDSAMVYREMNIGTAKPDPMTLKKTPHHLINLINPNESYSAAQFCKEALTACESIQQRHKIPLLVGGTMMYFRALQQGLSSLPSSDPSLRSQLMEEMANSGLASLYERLAKIDPHAAARLHPHDTQRILRALEVYLISGKPLSYLIEQAKKNAAYRYVNIVLMPADRKWLHQRIAQRFDHMLNTGLIEEVRELIQRWHLNASHPAMRSVGYRQVMAYLHDEYDLSTLREKGIAATRQLAKRQLTWLRHWPDSHSVTAEKEDLLEEIKQRLSLQ